MKGQLKIQEMAFVLVAVIIFLALVLLVYFSIRSSSLQKDAQSMLEDNARALVSSIARYPELTWSDCSNCIDLDKALVFKERGNSSKYDRRWEVDYLMIERIYPNRTSGECASGNYPACSKITLIGSNNSGAVYGSFVNLCKWDESQSMSVCELGKVYASGRSINTKVLG